MTEYVDWFVDREKERQGFLAMLDDKTVKRIMLVQALEEMGKTWLIQRIRHQCRVQGIPVAHFDFGDRLTWDCLAIVRKARDDFDPAAFNYLTSVINQFTGANVQVTVENLQLAVNIEHSDISHSQVDINAREVIEDEFGIVRSESERDRRHIEARMTDAFFVSLSALADGQKVVFLFDTYEEAPPEAHAWVESELLRRVRDDQFDENVIVIVAGRATPRLDEAWKHIVARTDLVGFEEPHVRDYIQKRGMTNLLEQSGFVDYLLLTGGKHPKQLAKMIDEAVINTLGPEEDDDWL